MKQDKKPKVSYHKKPADLTTQQWQKQLRRQFVAEKELPFIINNLAGEHRVFADYSVENPISGGVYKVALRSRTPGPNFCTCMDFKTNMLGTCKHIEAVLHQFAKNKKTAKLLLEDYRPAYSSMFLHYGQSRQVMLRIGLNQKEQYEQLARSYFDKSYRLLPDAYDRIDQILKEAVLISPDFRAYDDAMDFIIAVRDDRKRAAFVQKMTDRNGEYFKNLLKVTLYPYQKEGILFATRAGRSLIADEMGLGKTMQAMGTTELCRKEFGIANVLIICPTSLKYQWKSEIEKFTDSTVSVIEGNYRQRQKQYEGDSFYKIISYNVAGVDSNAIKKLAPVLSYWMKRNGLKTGIRKPPGR